MNWWRFNSSIARFAAYLTAEFNAERERWILWAPVAFGIGVGSYFGFGTEPTVWLGPAACVMAVAAALFFRSRQVLFLIAVALGLVAAGFSCAKIHSDAVAAPVLEKPSGVGRLSGRVLRVEAFPDRPRVLLDRLDWHAKTPLTRLPERVLIRVKSETAFEVGDRIEGKVRLMPLPGPVAPGAYDYQRKSWFDRVGATGFAVGKISINRQEGAASSTLSPNILIAGFRQRLAERIASQTEGAEGAVIIALITGDRSRIPPAVTDAMRDSGLAHLLAISGLHIGLVATLIFGVVRLLLTMPVRLALRIDAKKWAAGAALIASFIYLLVSGATLPTQRAFIMGAMVLLAVMLDREAISLRMVALSALLILVWAPESILSASFQMSFAAVTGLVAFYEHFAPRMRRSIQPSRRWRRRILLYFLALLATTVVAGISTGLIAYYHFGRMTHYGVVANLLAVPITALWVMPAAVLSGVLMPFGLESGALSLMGAGTGLVLAVATEIAEWPGAVTLLPKSPLLLYLVIVGGGLWVCLMRRRWRWWGGAAIAASLFLAPTWPKPDVLISASGKLVAVRLPDGSLSLSQLSRERFLAERWLQQNGQREAVEWAGSGRQTGVPRCDSLGCLYRIAHHRIALVRHHSALEEDCGIATLVMTRSWRRHVCSGPIPAITGRHLRRNGAHAVYLGGVHPRIVTVNGVRGQRPWTRRTADTD